ncbi:MAG: Gfo/Idh/MocA family oxidoreductase [Phycisphaerales bacterium]|nr:Gfo/Idh/MocA family oxidoreductase [Phycisphaerales bacterium]MCB9862616.1 Gfo/Idh/MocA family oxidoreductase [Phycisphaerales bacterium]
MSETTGWGILGCGRMTDRRVAPAFRQCPTARLVAFQSRDAGKAEAYRAKYDAEIAYSDIDAFLANDDVQAVYIATPPAMHVEHVLQCLDAGKHVLVDKPIALTAADALRLVDSAEHHGKTLGVLHQQRFHPAIRRLVRLATDGTLGALHVVRIQIAMWLRIEGNWRYDAAVAGGGAAMDLAPHALDILLHLLGAPRRITATTSTHCLDADVEDFCAATIDFEKGPIGLVDVSYSAHGYGGRIEAFGDRGTFVSDGCLQQADEFTMSLRTADESVSAETHRYDGMCFRDAIEDFSAAVRMNRAPIVTGRHAVRVMRAIGAIYDSAGSGRSVSIPPE